MKIELTNGMYIRNISETWSTSDCKFQVWVTIEPNSEASIFLWDVEKELRKHFNFVEYLWNDCFLCDVKEKEWCNNHFIYNEETKQYQRI